jgi:hypothetical protein
MSPASAPACSAFATGADADVGVGGDDAVADTLAGIARPGAPAIIAAQFVEMLVAVVLGR